MRWQWEKGRQNSGYFKLKIMERLTPIPLDMYLLKYPQGSFIPPHKDPVTAGRHFRLNIILKKPKKGGVFYSEHTLINTSRIKLFNPDISTHSLSPIEEGQRWVLSIGWIVSGTCSLNCSARNFVKKVLAMLKISV